MMTERDWHPASVIAGQLYVVGGSIGNLNFDSAERFDPVGNLWQPMAPMAAARLHHSTSVIARKLYVCGGYGANKFVKKHKIST